MRIHHPVSTETHLAKTQKSVRWRKPNCVIHLLLFYYFGHTDSKFDWKWQHSGCWRTPDFQKISGPVCSPYPWFFAYRLLSLLGTFQIFPATFDYQLGYKNTTWLPPPSDVSWFINPICYIKLYDVSTLLRVIPTMTFIHFVTGKSSGILSDIPSGILSGISSGILSGISSGILAGISSAICSGISSGILSGISSGILSGKHSGTLSGTPTGILSDILSGRWGPAVHTELGRSQVEVQRWCTLSWEGPRLRSSGAHWARKVPGWGPAVHTERGRSQVEVQRCTLRWECPRLSWEVGKELGGSWGETGGGEGGRGELVEEEENSSDKI